MGHHGWYGTRQPDYAKIRALMLNHVRDCLQRKWIRSRVSALWAVVKSMRLSQEQSLSSAKSEHEMPVSMFCSLCARLQSSIEVEGATHAMLEVFSELELALRR